MELGYMRSEMHQIPQHMVTWLAQQSFVRVAEVERLVQAAIHGLDALQGIIMDPIFGELQEGLAEIQGDMQQPADNGSSGDSGHDRGYTLLQSLLTLEWFMQHH